MRRRSSFFARPRTKKIRPLVRVKNRTAKKGGRCSACRGRYEAGDPITVAIIKRRTYHTHTCIPANIEMGPVVGGPSVSNTPESVVKALSSNWNIGEAKMVAMLALENALVAIASKSSVTPEMEKSFERYNKLKAVAMRPGSDTEELTAARRAVIELVKVVF